MSKLGISKFMQPPCCCHTEVPPDVLAAAEVQLLHCPRAGLETLSQNRAEMEEPGLRLTQQDRKGNPHGLHQCHEYCLAGKNHAQFNHVESPCSHPDSQLTSSGFSLVIRAAMTWPLGMGGLEGLWKQMGVSPQGLSPYSTLMSFILCKGMPIAICRRDKGLSSQGDTNREPEWRTPSGKPE